MLKPHFEYGSTILYTCCTEQQLTRLQKLQNMLRLNWFTPTILMLDARRWLNVRKRLELNTQKFIQKIKIGEAPEYTGWPE